MEVGDAVSTDADPRRRYDGTRRQADAQARQAKIVEAGRKLFLEKGFGPTSIGQIAEVAGVSPQTIYATFGSKAGVLARAIDVSVTGDYEDVPAFERAPDLTGVAEFAEHARFLRALNERVAPLIRVMEQACATDPSLAELRAALTERIRADCRRWVAQIGQESLRDGLTEAAAADLLTVIESPIVYSMLTADGDWTADRYQQWIADAIPALLLRRP